MSITRQVWTVFAMEWRKHSRSGLTWTLWTGHLLFTGVVFSLMLQQSSEAYFQDFFAMQAILVLFEAPLVSMNPFAGERQSGMLDLVRSTGISDWALVIGRFLGTWTLVGLWALSTAAFPAMLGWFLPLERGTLVAGYLGLALVAGGFSAIGTLSSVLAATPVSAAVYGFLGGFAGVFFTFFGAMFPNWQAVFGYFSLLDQMTDFSLGVLDSRRVFFFGSLIAMLVFWAGALFADTRRERPRERGRLLHQGNRWVVLAASFLVFVLGNAAVSTHPSRLDLTRGQRLSLDPRTRELLRRTDAAGAPLTLHCFLPREMESVHHEETRTVLRELDNVSNTLTVVFHSLDGDPQAAQKLGVNGPGQAVLVSERKQAKVTFIDERSIAGAIARVLREKPATVCFTAGHGEGDAGSAKADGRNTMTIAASELRAAGFELTSTTLYQDGAMPPGTTLAVVAGPKLNYLAREEAALQEFLDAGGHALFLIDPPPAPSFGGLLSRLGIMAGDDMLIDTGDFVQGDMATPVLRRYYPHPVTLGLGQVALPVCRSVDVAKTPPAGHTVGVLAETSEKSFAELTPSKVHFDQEEDIPGPVPVAAFSERGLASGAVSRVIAIGDSDFARDGSVAALSNLGLFLNCVQWLADGADGVFVAPKSRVSRIVLPRETLLRLVLASLFGVPLLPLLGFMPMILSKRKGIVT